MALKVLHRLWVFVGLAGIVAFAIYKGTRPGAGKDAKEFTPVIVAVVVWLAIVIVLSMAIQLRKGHQIADTSAGSASDMLRVMAVRPDLLPQANAALRKMGRTTNVGAALLPLAILGPVAGAIIALGGDKHRHLGYVLAGVAIGIAFVLSVIVIILIRRPIWKWLDDLVKPLGLGVISHPMLVAYPTGTGGQLSARPWGSTVLGGVRGGRQVEIIDTVTAVASRVAPLSIHGRGGRLQIESGPQSVAGLLNVPGPWNDVHVTADGNAVRVARRFSVDAPPAAFLYDLALAERIASADR